MPMLDTAFLLLEEAINHYLALDDEAISRLESLHGKVIAFEITGFGQRIHFIPAPGKIQLLARIEGEPDCVIKGSAIALAKLSTSDDKSEQLFGGDVEISGDTALAHRFGQILAKIDIDWEEHLSRVVGDIPAHQMGRAAKGFSDWAKSSRKELEWQISEYLQEELRATPRPEETSDFIADIDTLRDDVDRLEARVERLSKNLNGDAK